MTPTVATLTATPAALTTWQLDPSHVEVGFAVRHLMISTVKGRFGAVRGTVVVEHDDFATAQVDVTIDAASVDTREPNRDAHLRSADFFDVEQFPTLTFKSRRVESAGGGQYRLIGDLTIHGVTREVDLDVVTEGLVRDPWGNEKAGFSAKGHLRRSEFGLMWNAALETGGVVLSDDVKLSIDVELTKQA
jgi:polyisoprenoid-binding protein YceI